MAEKPCAVQGCDRLAGVPGSARGWCGMHYKRWRNHGDVNWQPKIGRSLCSVDECGKPVNGRDWCSQHYTRWKRYGDPTYRMPGEVVEGKRICPRCKVDKPISEYSKSTGRCYSCDAERMRRGRAAGRVRNRKTPRWKAICDRCGVSFMADRRRWRYCSPECFEAYKHRANWKHVVARRAKLKGVLVEVFDRVEIFERDRWKCQICKEPVDRKAEAPDPRAPSLDHILPISRGGKHERSNVRTSHLGCNVRKGAFAEVLF